MKKNTSRTAGLFFLLVVVVVVAVAFVEISIVHSKAIPYTLESQPNLAIAGLEEVLTLKNTLTDFSPSIHKTGFQFWSSLERSFTCPEHLLTKVGGPGSGLRGRGTGKWACGIRNVGRREGNDTPCVVYSFGVGYDSIFEADVLNTTSCTVYAYDPGYDKIASPLNPDNPRVHFHKMGVGEKNTGNRRTLKTLMEENGHQWVDIVKMDAELAEFGSMNRAMEDFPEDKEVGLPFGQLLVEVHVWEWHDHKNITVDRAMAAMVVDYFQRLERWGLRIFNYEINGFGGGNCCCEFSFVNIYNAESLKRIMVGGSN